MIFWFTILGLMVCMIHGDTHTNQYAREHPSAIAPRRSLSEEAQVTTLAGSDSCAFADGTGAAASFDNPYGVAISRDGTTMYVSDLVNHRIRKIDVATAAVTTLAGSGSAGYADGTGVAASFNYQYAVALSPDDTTLYVADESNHRIRTIDLGTAAVTTLAGSGSATFADGTGAAASFYRPAGVVVSPDGTTLYVGDKYNHRVREIDLATAAVTTLAGSGSATFADGSTGSAASFNRPAGVALSPDGTTLYVADGKNNRVRQVDVATGATTTLAGSSEGFADGTGGAASFYQPVGVTISPDPDGTTLYVAEDKNHRIREIDLATAAVTTLAGSGSATFADGTGAAASFSWPADMAASPDGTALYVADPVNCRIRKITLPCVQTSTCEGRAPDPSPPSPPTSPPRAPPKGIHLADEDAGIHFGPNFECKLGFEAGPPPKLVSSCVIE